MGNFSEMPLNIIRQILFPNPLKTDRVRLNVVDGDAPTVLKMDLLGSAHEKSYMSDPFYEKRRFTNGRKIYIIKGHAYFRSFYKNIYINYKVIIFNIEMKYL